MAISAAAIAAKAALVLATDKRTWKAAAVAVAAICLFPVLIILLILNLLGGSAKQNNSVLDVVFNGAAIPSPYSQEYTDLVLEMRDHFSILEDIAEEIAEENEWEEELDLLRVKAVFFALYFGADPPEDGFSEEFLREFVECFLSIDAGEDEDSGEEYETAVPLKSLQEIYDNVGDLIGRPITPEDMANINTIYIKVKTGDFSTDSGNVSLEGGANGTHDLIREMTKDDDSPGPIGGFAYPFDQPHTISCEFGGYEGHTGMDIAVPVGNTVRAVADGTVLFTRAGNTGYGIYVVINHGGGVVTLYAHNSKLLVGEGQKIAKGDPIALSGNTGNSTGPHLHLEFVIDGVPMNPRLYL